MRMVMQIPMEQRGNRAAGTQDNFWRELAITFVAMLAFVSIVYLTFGLTAAAIALVVPMSLSLVYGIR